MASFLKRLGKETSPAEKETEPKLYGSLRALRSRPSSPAKRRSRSLELPNEPILRENTHSRYPSLQETLFKRSATPSSRPHSPAVTGLSSSDNNIRDSAVSNQHSINRTDGATTPTKKRRGSFLSRALSSLRNSTRSPGHSAVSQASNSESNGNTSSSSGVAHMRTTSPPPARKLSFRRPSRLREQTEEISNPTHVGMTSSSSIPEDVQADTLTSPSATPPDDDRYVSMSSRDNFSPLPSNRDHIVSELPPSASEPPLRASLARSTGTGHLTDSVSDPGPPPVVNIINATPPRNQNPDIRQTSRDEAYQRLVKAERRKSPLAKLIPPMFRRNSADVQSETKISRVGSPILRAPTREERSSTSLSVPEPTASSSRTKITLTGSTAPPPRKIMYSRHDSFDFEVPSTSKTASVQPSDTKVRFVEPAIEERADGDSGVSGLRSEVGHGSSQVEYVQSKSHRPSKADAQGRVERHDSRRTTIDSQPRSLPSHSSRVSSSASDPKWRTNATAGPAPLGTTSTSHGLPLFSFEQANPSPSPSATSFSSHTSARSVPATSSLAPSDRRRNKAQSLELGIGLTWAPTKVRQEAVISFGKGNRMGKSKWGIDARMSEVLLEDNGMQEFGMVAPKQDIMQSFKQVLDEPGYITFKRYCRRFEVGALPLDGPTGVLNHLDRLLESASSLDAADRRHLLDRFAHFAQER